MSDELVCVATAANVTEATQWQQALEAEGIPCRVVDHNEAEWFKVTTPRTEVWVSAANLARAREVLAHPGEHGLAASEGDGAPRRRSAEQAGEGAQPGLRRQGTDGTFRRPASRGK
jgi:hypothetical protein